MIELTDFKRIEECNIEEIKEVLLYFLSKGYVIKVEEAELGYTNNLSLNWSDPVISFFKKAEDILNENGKLIFPNAYSDEVSTQWFLIREKEWIPIFHKEFDRAFLRFPEYQHLKRKMEEEQNLQLEERE